MDMPATVTSKGQITLPKDLRDALDLRAGDKVLFRVHKDRAVLAKVPSFLELAGSVPVPPRKKGTTWSKIRSETWNKRAQQSR
jgi:antitoxin PrlF